MVSAPIPANDPARVAALRSLEILDTDPEQEFDAIVKLAAEICGVPIALVSLLDESRQWFKARVGLEAPETPRDISFCGHVITGDETMIVPNAGLDPRFADNPLRTGAPNVEFYAGVPLRTSGGLNVGTLCVIDHEPRSLSPAQKAALESLAAQVVRLLELRRATILQRQMVTFLRESDEELRRGELESVPEPRGWNQAPFAIAALLGVASVGACLAVHSSVEAAGAVRLGHVTERVGTAFEDRVQAYEEIVRGAGALFRASDHVSPTEFRTYVEALELKRNHTGLLGLGFSESITRDELPAWLAEVRRETPDFRLQGEEHGPKLAVNRLIEPLEVNRGALGFDIMTDPKRIEALERSLRSEGVVATHRVRLRQDPNGGGGFILLLPLPAKASNKQTAGWTFAAVRAHDLLAGLQSAAGEDVTLRVIDDPAEPPLLGEAIGASGPSHAVPVRFADRSFRIEARPGPSFYSLSERTEPWAILVLGLGATALAFGLTTALRKTDARSREIAARMTTALRRGERELRAVIDGTTDLIIAFADDGRLLLTNRSFRQTVGCTESETSAMTISDVVHPDQRDEFHKALTTGETAYHVETTFLSRKGTSIDVEGALSFFVENGRRVTRAIFRDISTRRQAENALRAANEALERIATVDGLTGVSTRRVFDERITEEIARARRNPAPLSVVLIDVDFFKLYNDTYGHPAGDECLRKIGSVLKALARRAGEIAVRYGGEEFVLLLPGSDLAAAEKVAGLARERIEALAIPHEKNPNAVATASFGVATFGPEIREPSELVAAADTALYRAKKAGRNRVELATTEG